MREDITSQELGRLLEMKEESRKLKNNLEILNKRYDRQNEKLQQNNRLNMTQSFPENQFDDLFPQERETQAAAVQRGLGLLSSDYKVNL